MKDFFVVFTSNNARIYKGIPKQVTDNILVNPDLTKVKIIPPHLWKRVGDEILPMDENEALTRLAHIDKYGVSNEEAKPYMPSNITLYVNSVIHRPLTFLKKVILFVSGALFVGLLQLIINHLK